MKYPKDIVLKNSVRVVLRPYEMEDRALLERFYQSISEYDRWFIPDDMMSPELQCKWSEKSGRECNFSIVAIDSDKIVAHANLQVSDEGHYTRHVGRLNIMVSQSFRRQRLGTWMVLDLVKLAMEKELRDLRVDFVTGLEDDAIDSMRKLDFFKQAVLEDYVMDPEGRRHDLVIMTKRLHRDFGDY